MKKILLFICAFLVHNEVYCMVDSLTQVPDPGLYIPGEDDVPLELLSDSDSDSDLHPGQLLVPPPQEFMHDPSRRLPASPSSFEDRVVRTMMSSGALNAGTRVEALLPSERRAVARALCKDSCCVLMRCPQFQQCLNVFFFGAEHGLMPWQFIGLFGLIAGTSGSVFGLFHDIFVVEFFSGFGLLIYGFSFGLTFSVRALQSCGLIEI